MKDDHGQAEEEHEEVPEGQSREDAVPRALQVEAVPHDAHEREVPHETRREQHEREQQHRVRPVGGIRDREQRIQEPHGGVGPRGGGVAVRPRRGEEAARVVVSVGRTVLGNGAFSPETTICGSSSDPVQAESFRPVRPGPLLCPRSILRLEVCSCEDMTEVRAAQKEQKNAAEKPHGSAEPLLSLIC